MRFSVTNRAPSERGRLRRTGKTAPGASAAGARSPGRAEWRLQSREVLLHRSGGIISRLGDQEFRRRVWHFFPGVLALAVAPIPHLDPVPLATMLILVTFGIILPAIVAVQCYDSIERCPGEDRWTTILGYGIPLLPMFLIFRGHLELGLAAAAIVAFGDGTATLTGLLYGKAKIPWNRGKSWVGMAGFFLAATLMASMIYWIEADPHIPFGQVLACISPAVAACAIVETFPWKGNDNLYVSITAAVMMVVMQSLVIGWS